MTSLTRSKCLAQINNTANLPALVLQHVLCVRARLTLDVQSLVLDQGVTLSLIDCFSDTLSHGCTNLQSLVMCLDHRGMTKGTHFVGDERMIVSMHYACSNSL